MGLGFDYVQVTRLCSMPKKEVADSGDHINFRPITYQDPANGFHKILCTRMSPNSLAEGLVTCTKLMILFHTRIVNSIPKQRHIGGDHLVKVIIATHWTIFRSVSMADILSSGDKTVQITCNCPSKELRGSIINGVRSVNTHPQK